jgi:hypothetical protein
MSLPGQHSQAVRNQSSDAKTDEFALSPHSDFQWAVIEQERKNEFIHAGVLLHPDQVSHP